MAHKIKNIKLSRPKLTAVRNPICALSIKPQALRSNKTNTAKSYRRASNTDAAVPQGFEALGFTTSGISRTYFKSPLNNYSYLRLSCITISYTFS